MPPQPRHRLGWLIGLGVCIIALLAGLRLIGSYWQQQREIRAIMHAGGDVRRDLPLSQFPLPNWIRKSDIWWPSTCIHVHLEHFDSEKIYALAKPLSRLRPLSKLHLGSMRITRPDLELLAESQTAFLEIENSECVDDFSGLQPFTDLKTLQVTNSTVDDRFFDWVSQQMGLKYLYFDGTRLTSDSLRKLKSLTHLETISVSNTGLDESDIEKLRKMFPAAEIHDD